MATRRRRPYISPARLETAKDVLQKIAENRDSVEPVEEEETELPEDEQEFTTGGNSLTDKVAEQKAQRAIIAEQEKLDTKVQIGDVSNFERKALPPVPKETTKKPVSIGKKDDVIAQRTQQWTRYLLDDANPLLVKATASFVGIPSDNWLDDVVMEAIDPTTNKHMVFWNPSLRSRLELDEKQANKLARAAAEFSVSPMGVAIVTWVETHQFMICVGAAMMVGAQYGWTLMKTKAEVTQLRTIYEQQMAAQMAQMQKPPDFQQKVVDTDQRLPGFNESVSEYDGTQS